MSRDDSDGSVGDRAVQDGDGTDGLCSASTTVHGDAGAAVVDGDTFVRPAPGPDLVDGSDSVVESKVAHRELLVAEDCTVETAIEDKIVGKTTGAWRTCQDGTFS